MHALSSSVVWFLVLNLGIAFGAGLYEHRIVLPRWITPSRGSAPHWNAGAAREDDPGRRFWVMVATLPLTLLVVANAFAAWAAPNPVRGWWLAAVCAAAAVRWRRLNYIRHACVLAAWLLALRALTLLYATGG